MSDTEETPPQEEERLQEFAHVHAMKVLREKSVDQDSTTTTKLCQYHCHDDKLDEVQVLLPVLQQTKGSRHSRLDHEVHPMHTDIILKKLFEFCSVSTLKSCRLVCKNWLKLSLKPWRQKAVVVAENIIEGKGKPIEHILKEGSEIRKIPFKSYNILRYERDSPHFYFHKKNNILNTFSSSIQYLEFHCDDFELAVPLILSKLPELRHVKLEFDFEDFRNQCQKRISQGRDCPFQNIPVPKASMSKLRKLQLHFSIRRSELDFNPFPRQPVIPWIKLFERVPALTSLQVKYELDDPYSDGRKQIHFIILKEILQAIKTVREIEGFTILNLQELDIMLHPNLSCIKVPISKSISDIIISSKFPLERLSIDIGSNCKATCVAELLAAHEETLKYLKTISAPDKVYLKKKLSFEIFPWMKLLPKMKELELLNGCVWAFHFLDCLTLPELEGLTIGEMKLREHRGSLKLNWKTVDRKFEEEHMHHLLDPLHFPNLKRFYYNGPRHFSPYELQRLAKAMPNVTDLGVPISAKTFPVVCELWPCVKSLRVGQQFDGTYPLIDDFAIVGIPLDIESNSPRDKNITDLKELWSFEVDENSGTRYSRYATITDVSAIYGFLLLPKLTVLKIRAICKFSSEVMAKLESHVPEIYINQNQFFEKDKKSKSFLKYSSSSDDESDADIEYSDPDC